MSMDPCHTVERKHKHTSSVGDKLCDIYDAHTIANTSSVGAELCDIYNAHTATKLILACVGIFFTRSASERSQLSTPSPPVYV